MPFTCIDMNNGLARALVALTGWMRPLPLITPVPDYMARVGELLALLGDGPPPSELREQLDTVMRQKNGAAMYVFALFLIAAVIAGAVVLVLLVRARRRAEQLKARSARREQRERRWRERTVNRTLGNWEP